MVNVVAHSAQSGAHGGAALTDKTSEKKLSADAKESSCVFISARKPSFLKLPGFPIVPPPFNVKGRRPIPRLIGVGVCNFEAAPRRSGNPKVCQAVSVCTGVTSPIRTTKIHLIRSTTFRGKGRYVHVRNYQASGGFHHKPNERHARVLPFVCQQPS